MCKTFTGNSRKPWTAYLQETMQSSKPEFYANLPLSSQVLCCKHYIFMYLDEYLAKL